MPVLELCFVCVCCWCARVSTVSVRVKLAIPETGCLNDMLQCCLFVRRLVCLYGWKLILLSACLLVCLTVCLFGFLLVCCACCLFVGWLCGARTCPLLFVITTETLAVGTVCFVSCGNEIVILFLEDLLLRFAVWLICVVAHELCLSVLFQTIADCPVRLFRRFLPRTCRT